ncbi:hypothetical protein LTR24_010758 [Lithohypha guttulata]|uniref:C2H2-type domain-containing protein n=1 Tax=Lithohypha guttulata TaxID=1690604 RepID=A0ABR0JSP8_9EURO|nr:hypothetical protein LTR24_010758 [Lithohypha guttulata]
MSMQSPPAAARVSIQDHSARSEREPPLNDHGEIICTHETCRGGYKIFKRPCEWNKHMDQHERPYKCKEPTCEQNAGFTYSGGLLRHMREVHKKVTGTARRPLYCPHANCVRSTGKGFTRQENLDEHLRRRHHGAIHDVQLKTTEISGPRGGPPTRSTFTPPAVVDVTLRVPTQPTQVNGANESTDIVVPAPRPTTRLALALAKQEQELVHAREEIMANKRTIDENNEEMSCLKRQLQAIEEFKPIGTARVDRGRLSPEDANSI